MQHVSVSCGGSLLRIDAISFVAAFEHTATGSHNAGSVNTDSVLPQEPLSAWKRTFCDVYETFLTFSCPYTFTYSLSDITQNYRVSLEQLADKSLTQGSLNIVPYLQGLNCQSPCRNLDLPARSIRLMCQHDTRARKGEVRLKCCTFYTLLSMWQQ